MGSSSSKPARKLASEATTTIKSSGASSRSTAAPSRPPPSASFESVAQAAVTRPDPRIKQGEASEEKNAAIMNDAMDPHFMANLAKLGAVKVPRNKLKYKPNDQMLSILRARDRETQASAPSTDASPTTPQANRLSAPTLISLLDARKSCRTVKDLEELAHGYDIDVEVIEDLARFVNSPSIRTRPPPPERQSIDKQEEGPALCDAVWTEPTLSVGSIHAPSNPAR